MTMIEKVARAIATEISLAVSLEELDDALVARAAIEAMKTPTAEMLAAAKDEDYPNVFADANTHWKAMIDQALKE